MFGVYAVVEQPGTLSLGGRDRVRGGRPVMFVNHIQSTPLKGTRLHTLWRSAVSEHGLVETGCSTWSTTTAGS